MQSNSIQVENETEPILIRSVCKQSYKLSSALVEATTPREPRIENREWRIELKKTFQTSFSSHLQLDRERESRQAGGGRRKRLKNQLTIHLKAANAFERYFFPTLRWDAVELGFSSALRERWVTSEDKQSNPLPPSLPRWPGQLTCQS